jgi:FkbM family methyltransferase
MPNNIRDELRAKRDDLILNNSEVRAAIRDSAVIPTLDLRNGFAIHHAPQDHVLSLVQDIFIRRCYTQPRFYSPAPGDTVIDCGANIGIFAIHLMSLEPALRVVCFEPCADSVNRLRLNVAANKLNDRVSVFNLGLWNCRTNLSLYVNTESQCTSFFESPYGVVSSREMASCATLTDALSMCNAPTVDLVKIDAEGSEVEILKSAGDPEWHRIKRVVVEYHETIRPGSRAAVMALLARYRFNPVDMHGNLSMGLITARRQ